VQQEGLGLAGIEVSAMGFGIYQRFTKISGKEKRRESGTEERLSEGRRFSASL